MTEPTAAFDVADAVPHVTWKASDGVEHVAIEPSTAQLTEFWEAQVRASQVYVRDMGKTEALASPPKGEDGQPVEESDEDFEARLDALKAARTAADTKVHGAYMQSVSDVLSGYPSVEEISSWDGRTQRAFLAYVRAFYRADGNF